MMMRRLSIVLGICCLLPVLAQAKRSKKKGGAKGAPAPALSAPAADDPTEDEVRPAPTPEPPPRNVAAAPTKPVSEDPPRDKNAEERKQEQDTDQDRNRNREATPAASSSPSSSADLEKLRAEYDRLRDELFKARARSQIVKDALYSSKMRASFRWKGAPDYFIHRAALRLDGTEIWDSGDKPVTDDLIKVAERGVKPGPHALSLRLEIRPKKKDPKFGSEKLGYVSEHTFAIVLPEGRRTHVAITGDEDGDAPEYEPEIEVELESEK
jgi:hypothetical protein